MVVSNSAGNNTCGANIPNGTKNGKSRPICNNHSKSKSQNSVDAVFSVHLYAVCVCVYVTMCVIQMRTEMLRIQTGFKP